MARGGNMQLSIPRGRRKKVEKKESMFRIARSRWVPGRFDYTPLPPGGGGESTHRSAQHTNRSTHHHNHHHHHVEKVKTRRSWKRRFFLFLTEPETSIASCIFFLVLVLTVTLMNVLMILQTMDFFNFTPDDCKICYPETGKTYPFDSYSKVVLDELPDGVDCVCPPAPHGWTVKCLDSMIHFFAVEWFLRIGCFELAEPMKAKTFSGRVRQFFGHVTSLGSILDALAIFPYYMENLSASNGLMSLRLLRLFRVLQLVRLGQYNSQFQSFTGVMWNSVPYLKLMMVVMTFGAVFFGSMLFWVEKGTWTYSEDDQDFRFRRTNSIGSVDISPFDNIPVTFWWFFVTSTTVGYGDVFPVTTGGRWIATPAMLLGVLVVAFPVSIFSQLWCNALREQGAFDMTGEDDEDDEDDDDDDDQESSGDGDGRHGVITEIPRDDAIPPECRVPQTTVQRVVHHHHHQQHSYHHGEFTDEEDTTFRVFDDTLVMEKEDILQIISYNQTINESLRTIRVVLKKYNLEQLNYQQ